MGGQAGTSSLIRNYLGFPRGISGAELATRAFDQAVLFGTEMVYGGDVVGLRANGNLRIVELADGTTLVARAVVVASGVSYRTLDVASLDALQGVGVYYGSAMSEARALTGEHAYVVGGGNSAGQAAMHLAQYAKSVTIVVRSNTLAASMSDYLVKSIERTPNIEIRYASEVVDGGGDGRLEWIDLKDRTDGTSNALRPPASSSSSAPNPALTGSRRRSRVTPGATSRPAATATVISTPREDVRRSCSRRPCPACSPSVMSARGQSSESRPPRAKEQTPNLEIRYATEVVDGGGHGRLEWIDLKDRTDGTAERVEAAGLFVLIGAEPCTEWLPPTIA